MRKINEVLRLKFEAGLGNHKIGRALGVSASTVWDALERFRASGLSWPLPFELSESALERRLYRTPDGTPANPERIPDWGAVQTQLHRKHVTLRLLWEEYKLADPDGFQYSWFCERFRAWQQQVDVVMRQEHKLGEKLFVDWAGDTTPVVDTATGELRAAYLFLAVFGASNYTYAEVSFTQDTAAFLSAHVRALAFFGGVPELVVCDNLKTGIKDACLYEPEANAAYQALSEHYGFCVYPARPARPRDKAKVEVGVLHAERRILARLRDRTFFSLGELQAAVDVALTELNERPFQKMPGSRTSVFLAEEAPALRPLPASPYRHYERKAARVHIDYHVQLLGHFYSVPYRLARERVEIRYSPTVVEIFHDGLRVASHLRDDRKGRATTTPEHMPPRHRFVAEWTPERFISWGASVGPKTEELVGAIMDAKPHPALGFRACLGLMRLAGKYGDLRLEAAAMRTLAVGGTSYRSVEHILRNGLERQQLLPCEPDPLPLLHANLRGPAYYTDTPGGES